MTIMYNCEGNGEVHMDVLKAICGDTSGKSMIDLCCGFAPQTRRLGFENKFYIDVVDRDLAEEKKRFLVIDIFYYITNFLHFICDTSFLLDAVEHFPKEKSKIILKWMEDYSKKQIIFTPLGDYIIETVETNNPDSHKSGWLPQEFEEMGYATIVFPNFHKLLNIGAFFAFKCENLEEECKRISNELNNKSWANLNN